MSEQAHATHSGLKNLLSYPFMSCLVERRTRRIARGRSVNAPVPFGLLLGAALIAAEATFDFGFSRTVYTIWATTALITSALCAFALPGDWSRKHNIWLLFWTFSFLVILKRGFITVLGVVMTASVLVCLIVRFDAMWRGCVEKRKEQGS
jgi:hypothetical protein